ncbi:MAG: kelch repeat-containing protein [Candidatus Bathyarchaeia archaeon]
MVARALFVCATENPWVSRAPMQQARAGLGVVAVNGKIYAIGGVGRNGFLATNEEYDPKTNTWASKAPMPTPRSAFGIAVYNNKIYCIGGYIKGGSTGVNEVYDPTTNTWTTKASMPVPSLNLQANAVNGKIYLIGGSPNATLNQVYNPVNDTWEFKAPAPTAISSYASAVVDNKIYIITSNLTLIYDTETDQWDLGEPAPLPIILGAAGVTTGACAPKRVYVFGANAETPFWQLTTQNFTVQSYDPQTDSWDICIPMMTGRYSVGVAVVDDLLYVIGGFTIEFPSGEFTINPSYHFETCNEQYTPLGYTKLSEQQPLEQQIAPFPRALITAVSIASVAVAGAGLLVYFKKFKKPIRTLPI